MCFAYALSSTKPEGTVDSVRAMGGGVHAINYVTIVKCISTEVVVVALRK